ncbi:MAG TPA: (d)CMP kinase [Candidatus Methanoperedens sp.]|nr:(d)CMP kinase [Candidatus Methanoperedens sp.]
MSPGARGLIIAIDGPAAAGKSTAGKALAARLGYLYIDTGALYRAVAWLAEREGLADAPGEAVARLALAADIRLAGEPARLRVLVDGRDVSAAIRTERLSQLSSRLSALPEVRAALLGLQRRLGAAGGVVMDGRDIGTVICPGADAKFFVTASPEARARRRYEELRARGLPADEARVRAELEERDRRDAGRDVAPLRAADDAVTIDTTTLTPGQVIDRMALVVESKLNEHKEG